VRCKQETQVLLFRRTHTHNGEALLVLSEEDVATCGCLAKDPDDKGEHCTKTSGQFLEDALCRDEPVAHQYVPRICDLQSAKFLSKDSVSQGTNP
jgi:hypothetical protein